MADITLLLGQDEILRLLADGTNETFKRLLQESLNAVLKIESREQLQADSCERYVSRSARAAIMVVFSNKSVHC